MFGICLEYVWKFTYTLILLIFFVKLGGGIQEGGLAAMHPIEAAGAPLL